MGSNFAGQDGFGSGFPTGLRRISMFPLFVSLVTRIDVSLLRDPASDYCKLVYFPTESSPQFQAGPDSNLSAFATQRDYIMRGRSTCETSNGCSLEHYGCKKVAFRS
jgi:hypothetical protein